MDSTTVVLVGFLITLVVALYQLEKHHANSLRLQEQHLKNELKLRIYERIAETLDEALGLVGKAHTNAMFAVSARGSRPRRSGLHQGIPSPMLPRSWILISAVGRAAESQVRV